LDGTRLDDESARVARLAFEIARIALGRPSEADPLFEIMAKRTIELAKAGQRNPDLLAEQVLADLRERPHFQASTRVPSLLEGVARMFKLK
jgi:hypothetical protein